MFLLIKYVHDPSFLVPLFLRLAHQFPGFAILKL